MTLGIRGKTMIIILAVLAVLLLTALTVLFVAVASWCVYQLWKNR